MKEIVYNKITSELIEQFKSVTQGKIYTNGDINDDYSHDEMPIYGKGLPDVVIEATTTEDIAAIVKLCYENRIKSKDPLVWLSICKKYLAFLGDNVLIKQALTKNNFQNEDCCENIYGQIVSIGEEGQLVLSSESGLIEIIGGSITKG